MDFFQAEPILRKALSHPTRNYTSTDEALDFLCKDYRRLRDKLIEAEQNILDIQIRLLLEETEKALELSLAYKASSEDNVKLYDEIRSRGLS